MLNMSITGLILLATLLVGCPRGQSFTTEAALLAASTSTPENQVEPETNLSLIEPDQPKHEVISMTQQTPSATSTTEPTDLHPGEPTATNIPPISSEWRHDVDAAPDWAPDGNRFVFASNQERASERSPNIPFDDQIWLMHKDGTNRQQLTDCGHNSNPDWGPNGIVFSSSCGKPDTWNHHIAIVDIPGTELRYLTHSLPGENTTDFQPKWSPDGSQIAFVRMNWDETGQWWSYGDLWVMNQDGTDAYQLTYQEFYIPVNIQWAPNGRYIALEEFGDYLGALWVFDLVTKNIFLVEEQGADCASWSPANGVVLTYALDNRDATRTIISHNIATEEKWITAQHPYAFCPQWSLEGYGLAYGLHRGNIGNYSMEIRVEKWQQTLIFSYDHFWLQQLYFDWNQYGELLFSAGSPNTSHINSLSKFIYLVGPDGNLIQLTRPE